MTENDPLAENTNFVYALMTAPGLVPGHGGTAFAARASGLYRSDDGGQTWQDALTSLQPPEPIPTLALAISPGYAQDGTLVVGSSGGVLRTTDRGASWKAVLLPPPPPTVSALAVSPHFTEDKTVLAATVEDGVYISTDGGESWAAWNFGLLDLSVLCLAISPNFAADGTLFAGAETGIARSTNGGRAWREIALPGVSAPVLSLAVSPGFAQDHTLLVGTESQGLWGSYDEGENWELLGNFKDPINGILMPAGPRLAGPDIVLVTGAGLWQSQDGENWRNRLPPEYAAREVSAAAVPGGPAAPVLVGFVDGGVEVVHLV